MTFSNSGKGIKQYQQVGVTSGIMDATPHRLVQMLLDGAVEKVATAKGAMERGDTAEKGRYVVWAISIIGGLRASLDLQHGGAIAANLDSLYEYVERRLTEANLGNDAQVLVEVLSLLTEIRDAWEAMPEQVKTGSAVAQQATSQPGGR